MPSRGHAAHNQVGLGVRGRARRGEHVRGPCVTLGLGRMRGFARIVRSCRDTGNALAKPSAFFAGKTTEGFCRDFAVRGSSHRRPDPSQPH